MRYKRSGEHFLFFLFAHLMFTTVLCEFERFDTGIKVQKP